MSVIQQAISFVFILTVLLLEFVDQGVAELCSSGIRCKEHEYCCGTSCCLYERSDGTYRYNYRVSFWNLWYFWFIILFVLMSCFGGCGYYKQRQRYSQTGNFHGSLGASITQVSHSFHRNPRRSRTLDRTPLPTTHSYFGYCGPAAEDPTHSTMQPPPYSEVISHPNMYPDNKIDPPPYPGYKHNSENEDTPPAQQALYMPDNNVLQNTVVVMPPPPPPQTSELSSPVQPPPYTERENTAST